MASSSTPAFPGWALLLAGLFLGQSRSLIDFLESFQALVNRLIVPVYSLCVFGYLAKLLATILLERKQRKRDAPIPTAPLVPPPVVQTEESVQDGGATVNMTGRYQLVSNDNFDGLLEAQGVPWALRKAADRARPQHHMTHVGNSLTIQIRGIIESQTTYLVGGPPVETNIRGRIFEDRMVYIERGVRTVKTAITEDYNVEVVRQLSPDMQHITMTSKAIFNDDRDDVVCVQQFDRIQ
mmetsp:Transcript_14055/g.20579  ORF Transcript_14055/g.20579 Transcript_14055/m.20579 type:complete len:238 (-) Transcript_14055:183-896(-)